MTLQTRHYIIGVLGVAVLGGLGWMSLRTDPAPVDFETVAKGPMLVTVNADGETRVRQLYEVSAPISGTLRRAQVEVGDPVEAGKTVVAVVEPAPPALLDSRSREQAEAAVREAQAALTLAEAQFRQSEEELSYAQTQYTRARTLTDRGVASQTSLEDASQILSIRLAAREAARSNVAMATSALARARATLTSPSTDDGADACCVLLKAPISGTVLSVDIVSESPVTAGTRLVSLGRTDDLEIVADLLSADTVGLVPGTRAIVERWGGPDPLEARLRSLDPSAHTKVSALGIEEQRVDAVFDITSPPELRAGLGDGYAVYLRVVTWEGSDVLQVPLSALFRQDGGWAVFRAIEGRARLTPVTIGHRNGVQAEITGGLEPGDRVILHPSDAISDGSPVVGR